VVGIAAAGAACLLLLLLITAIARRTGFSEYRPGLAIMPILFAGGVVSVMAAYEIILLVSRRFYLTMITTSAGAVVAVVGGFVISASSPSLHDYAWLFAVSQAVSTGGLFVAGEVTHRRALRRRATPAAPEAR
jgi:hypothetical protein